MERIHTARYRYAAGFVRGRSVLDIATGIGYGAHLLATGPGAASVTGVDISTEAIRAATERYAAPNLRFTAVTPGVLPFSDGEFDGAVSFETIEHAADPAAFLREVVRVVKPGGPIILSTPNRRFHSFGRSRPWNPHHAVEFTPDGFLALLRREVGEPEFWGGQEFMPVTPAAIVKHNWVEMRYYILRDNPIYRLAGRTVRLLRAVLRGGGRASGHPGEAAVTMDDRRCAVHPWEPGREPYTIVAICRKPLRGGP